jgi:hypothetical protein
MDAIILKKKVRYLDLVAICEARHARPKWMKDDDDYLKPFATKKEKQKERHKISRRDCDDDTMGRHGCHICAIIHAVSLVSII